ncbi:hypothetical protein AAMO2058_001034500 [Amorphochlora amoebiformis]
MSTTGEEPGCEIPESPTCPNSSTLLISPVEEALEKGRLALSVYHDLVPFPACHSFNSSSVGVSGGPRKLRIVSICDPNRMSEIEDFLDLYKGITRLYVGEHRRPVYILGVVHLQQTSSKVAADLVKLTKPSTLILELGSERIEGLYWPTDLIDEEGTVNEFSSSLRASLDLQKEGEIDQCLIMLADRRYSRSMERSWAWLFKTGPRWLLRDLNEFYLTDFTKGTNFEAIQYEKWVQSLKGEISEKEAGEQEFDLTFFNANANAPIPKTNLNLFFRKVAEIVLTTSPLEVNYVEDIFKPVLIDERDAIIARAVIQACKKSTFNNYPSPDKMLSDPVVVVVGAAHVPGVVQHLDPTHPAGILPWDGGPLDPMPDPWNGSDDQFFGRFYESIEVNPSDCEEWAVVYLTLSGVFVACQYILFKPLPALRMSIASISIPAALCLTAGKIYEHANDMKDKIPNRINSFWGRSRWVLVDYFLDEDENQCFLRCLPLYLTFGRLALSMKRFTDVTRFRRRVRAGLVGLGLAVGCVHWGVSECLQRMSRDESLIIHKKKLLYQHIGNKLGDRVNSVFLGLSFGYKPKPRKN